MNCPYCGGNLIDGDFICPDCQRRVIDFDYFKNMDKMREKYSKFSLLDLSEEKLTFGELITIYTYIERADHFGGDGEVSDGCSQDGTYSNLSKRLKEIRAEAPQIDRIIKNNIEIIKIDITDLDADAIVNAANSQLHQGGGVCGAIFRKAGPEKLKEACSKIGGCKTGSAVITPAFNLKANYIIHAVGPVWQGGGENEEKLLYGAYEKSLDLAMKNNCHSIAFPLISSGIYGYPKRQAWQVAIKACKDFIRENNDYSLNIIFAVLSDSSKALGKRILYRYL